MQKIKNAASNININSPIPTSLADPGQGLDKVIPANILAKAEGLAIFTVLKAGFLFSGRAGSGLVVARLVSTFCNCNGRYGGWRPNWCGIDRLRLGDEHEGSMAAGPIGRNAEASGTASLKHVSAVYSYSKTRGFFAGVSLEGSVIITRNDANEKLYGKRVSAKELLNGSVTPPPEADVLYRALNARFHTLGNTGAMYQRYSSDESPSPHSASFRSSTISAPGTLRPPEVHGHPNNSTPHPPPYASNTYSSHISNYKPPPSLSHGPSVPATITTRAPPPPPPSRKPHITTARALYDFNGEQPGDLSFHEGDIITITEKSNSQEDWWTGSIGARKGVFPANYVQLQ
ncbi:hypothetical protein BX666DRAFT_2017174 [Dichotomocladium elegans]|nr:hypothetical protein BX666DRAFT_2017174 [Dichotomocladium elegans]